MRLNPHKFYEYNFYDENRYEQPPRISELEYRDFKYILLADLGANELLNLDERLMGVLFDKAYVVENKNTFNRNAPVVILLIEHKDGDAMIYVEL